MSSATPTKGSPLSSDWPQAVDRRLSAQTLRGDGVTTSPVGTTVSKRLPVGKRSVQSRSPFEAWIVKTGGGYKLLVEMGKVIIDGGYVTPTLSGLASSSVVSGAWEATLPCDGVTRAVYITVTPPDENSQGQTDPTIELSLKDQSSSIPSGSWRIAVAVVASPRAQGGVDVFAGKVAQRIVGDVTIPTQATQGGGQTSGYTGDIEVVTDAEADYYRQELVETIVTLTFSNGLLTAISEPSTRLVATLRPERAL